MQCPNPIHLKAHPFRPQKTLKDGTIIKAQKAQPARDVPCGKCHFCVQNKRNGWALRLQVELKHAKSAYFLTLTYNDDHINMDTGEIGMYDVSKRDVQLWLKRLRKQCVGGFRYYLVSEYGTNGHRPHYHALLFNVTPKKCYKDINDLFTSTWTNGFCFTGTVSPQSINYVTKYVFKKGIIPVGATPNFVLCSKRPALGAQYIEHSRAVHAGNVDRFYAVLPDGVRVSLPRYYAERLYSTVERQVHSKRVSMLPQLEQTLFDDPTYGGFLDPFHGAAQIRQARVDRANAKLFKNEKL